MNNWVYRPPTLKISDTCPAYDEEARSLAVVIKNRNGLHVRPASRLVYTLSTFNADMLLEKKRQMRHTREY
ncbi:dihydroxyacetone kinase subunit M [Escherichia coli]|uniref:Dihydroxyacetone kinase subunit M n=1 Tax=Escherichia coli TaxID=562 RepID=A0A376KVG3_ECOLX|nr:dihydroxyacetone kinase subunit M [Escherichia coli]